MMKTNQSQAKSVFPLLWIASLLFSFSCSKDELSSDDPVISMEDANAFNAAVANLGTFTQPEELSGPVELNEEAPERDGQLECIVKNFKAAPGFDELLSLDPTTDVIYPGALLNGESIPTGQYTPIAGDRAPITLSASLTNISGSPVVVVEDPKLSTVREGVKQILDQEVTGATPARVSFEITQVYNEQQLNVAIGANYRSAGRDVSAAIDFSNTTKRNKFVLKYLQTYYTIDMDLPSNPSDLFNSLPDLSVLGSTAPVFVSSVAYGRMVIYTIETNSSESEINAALSATFASGDGSVDASFEETINESSIKGLIIGGSGSGAAQAINGPSQVYAFISEGGNYSKDSPGAPLAYKLRFIKQGTPIARVVLSTEYPVRTCDLAWPKYELKLVKIAGSTYTNRELYGKLEIRMWSQADGDFVRENPNNPGVDNAWWNRENTSAERVNVKDGDENSYNFDDAPIDDEFFSYDIEPYRPNRSTDYFEYRGHLFDNELIGYDDLGEKTARANLDDLGENALTEQQVKAAFLIDETKSIGAGVYYYSHSFEDGITVYYKITEK